MLFHNDLLQGVQVCMSASEDDDKSDGSSDLTWIVSRGKEDQHQIISQQLVLKELTSGNEKGQKLEVQQMLDTTTPTVLFC